MSIKLLLAITTHNEEDHIELQLDNAIELGCYDKIVILDDGSTDSTCEIIEKYLDKNKNIYLFKNELNSVLNNGENRWVTISNIIRDGGFNPDWVNNRVADILYPINSGGKLLSQVAHMGYYNKLWPNWKKEAPVEAIKILNMLGYI